MESIHIKKSIFQAGKLIVLSGAFVALGIWSVTSEQKSPWIGWMCLLFFGSAFLFGIFQLFDRRTQLEADSKTLFDRVNLKEPISWSSVDTIRYEETEVMFRGFKTGKQSFAVVTLRPWSGEPLNLKLKKRIFQKANRNPFTFTILLTPLEGKASDIFAQLERFRRMSQIE